MKKRNVITWRSRWLMTIGLLGALLVAGLLAPVGADAHAQLEGTAPAAGSVLETQPDQVTLTFNESVSVVPEGMQLFNSDGPVATLEASVADDEVDIALPDDLEDGTYVVGWRVVSADSHPITGALTFSIGSASSAPIEIPSDSSNVMPVMGTVTAIAYGSMLLAVGIIWFRVFIVHAVDRQTVRIAFIAAVISGIAHLLLIPLTEIRDVGESVSALFDPGMWKVDPLSLTLRAVIMVVVGLAFEIHYAPAGPTRRLAKWGVALGGLLALGSLTVVGHTTTVGPTALVHGADFVHGLAGATWFGSLIGLGIYLTMSIRGKASAEGPTPAEATDVVVRFSWIAGVIFAALALSGGIMAVRILGSWDALLHTTYGKVLIAKLSVVVVPFLIATWNRLRLVPAVERAPDSSSAWGRLRLAVLAEGAFLVVILGITGFLVLQNPTLPNAAAGDPETATVPFEQTATLGEGSIEMRLEPGVTGVNDISLTVLDASGNPVELLEDPEVQLLLPAADLGPLSFIAMPTDEPGKYTGQIEVPIDGDWTIHVVTRTSKFEAPIGSFEITIPHTTDASATPSPVGGD